MNILTHVLEKEPEGILYTVHCLLHLIPYHHRYRGSWQQAPLLTAETAFRSICSFQSQISEAEGPPPKRIDLPSRHRLTHPGEIRRRNFPLNCSNINCSIASSGGAKSGTAHNTGRKYNPTADDRHRGPTVLHSREAGKRIPARQDWEKGVVAPWCRLVVKRAEEPKRVT
jgi:hypothetical protein